ncbi:LysM peptidoglycan-binding domain-containing C40 family peptidase [Alicyclobacillus sp.]|uniref:C40 family peptidase n=1 Tax=Alicyclobacillus sp. TaxID=61169 RepID=UPI0025BFA250|nr:LysM peptidoglycan-binding domain-containing C40 family peptidase [Alicyclobacillus sp.]MCL6517662.1 LysM peptidoglycan-binding domain-containing C40 family peptidase [Alicyclobacillus sp.]
MKKTWLAAGALLSTFWGFGGAAMAATTDTYTVQRGDTLYKIATKLGISLADLERANPQIPNFNVIWPGEVLHLPSQPTPADTVIAKAMALLGTPYGWGGNTPQTGFDCSGFVQYVFGQVGVALPRTAHEQATVGTPVSVSQLQKGDLLFWKDTYANSWANHVTHVGIYLGGGDVIESSSSHNGIGVIVVHNIWQSPYYTSHYWGARRVLPQP